MISLGNVRNARSHTCRRMVWLDGLSTPSVRRLRAQTLSWNHARHHGALSQEAPTWEHEKSRGVVCTLTGESHPLNCALMTIRNGLENYITYLVVDDSDHTRGTAEFPAN